MKFFVTIHRDEVGAYVVECPAVPGCVSQGSTEEEALQNIPGRDPPVPRGSPGARPPSDGSGPRSRCRRLMAALPVLSGRDAAFTFQTLGGEVARQRGSHIIPVKAGHPATLSVPDHRESARGTLRALLRRAGLTTEEFLRARE